MSQRFSGQTARRYDEHMEHSRRALFAKDREIRKLRAALSRVGSTFEYIQDVIRDEGRRDPEWTLAQVTEAIGRLGLNVNDTLIWARRETGEPDGRELGHNGRCSRCGLAVSNSPGEHGNP